MRLLLGMIFRPLYYTGKWSMKGCSTKPGRSVQCQEICLRLAAGRHCLEQMALMAIRPRNMYFPADLWLAVTS